MVYLGPSFQIYSIQLTPKMDIEVRNCIPLWLRRSIRLSSSCGISLPSLPGVSGR